MRVMTLAIFLHFNSRPSARGDGRSSSRWRIRFEFQFTPLREGRHAFGAAIQLCDEISIHAPPRGATW